MRIVFMGTPQYCVPTLSKLKDAGHDIAAVFCQPDKPVGRKQILTPPPTKIFAADAGIPVFQPVTLRDGSAEKIISEISPDIIVVVAYGKILPESILNMPKYGAINGHASLLPKLRGASPIQWAIVTGETKTGVTVMQMDKGMDTGDILAVKTTDILPDETAGELFDRLSVITADLIVETLVSIKNNTAVPVKQNESEATYTPIIRKDMAQLDFTKTAGELCREVRGFNPWPVSYFTAFGKRYKVLKAKVCDGYSGNRGEILCTDSRLIIACGNNSAIEIFLIQPEGKKPMSAADMLKGHKFPSGTMLC